MARVASVAMGEILEVSGGREERVEAERVSSGHIERRLDLSGGKA